MKTGYKYKRISYNKKKIQCDHIIRVFKFIRNYH